MTRTWLITGSDTGVGKTVLTCLLARRLRELGHHVAAFKPLCSGGRDDAMALHAALDGELTLDEINPWHFVPPIAPVLAARGAGMKIHLADVVMRAHRLQATHEILLVEGAGGLLSPMGEDFSSLELLVALRAKPVVVSANRLGAVNQTLLVLAALPPRLQARAPVVLVDPRQPDESTATNRGLLAERVGAGRIHELPWLRRGEATAARPLAPFLRHHLDALLATLDLP